MSVSVDYDVGSVEAFKNICEDVTQFVDGDTVIKTVNLMINFQISQPGLLWGNTLKDRTQLIQRNYPVPTLNNLSDAEIIARLKKTLEEFDTAHALGAIKEIIEFLPLLEMDKYPNLLALLCEGARGLDDKTLFKLINTYQLATTALLSDEDPEKIRAKSFAELTLQSPEVQNCLASIRKKVEETHPIDLAHEARTLLTHTLPILAEFLENKTKEDRERAETLLLPIDSEKVRQLIAPIRNKIAEKNRKAEIQKITRCCDQATDYMKLSWAGKQQLSSVNVQIVYTKRSDPTRDLVYTKTFPHRSRG